MAYFRNISLVTVTAFSLSACGGGGGNAGGGGAGTQSVESYANRLSALQGDQTLLSPSPQETVDAMTGSVTYNGVINISTKRPENPSGMAAYYGGISVAVDFDDGSLKGSASDFVQYFSEVASDKTGSAVPGTLRITGGLTTNNESLGEGISGRATGAIDGQNVAYDMGGHVGGVSGNGMMLDFDGADTSAGIAILVR